MPINCSNPLEFTLTTLEILHPNAQYKDIFQHGETNILHPILPIVGEESSLKSSLISQIEHPLFEDFNMIKKKRVVV